MNSVKIGTLVIAGFLAMNSFAQEERGERVERTERSERAQMTPEQKASQQTERINKRIPLTTEQKARIYEVNFNVNAKNSVIRESDEMTKKYKKEALDGNNKSRMYLIREALTTEQQAKWDTIQQEKAADKLEKKESHKDHDHKGEHEGHNHD